MSQHIQWTNGNLILTIVHFLNNFQLQLLAKTINTKDGDLGEGPEALIWTLCDLRSSLWIAEVDKENFLSFRL